MEEKTTQEPVNEAVQAEQPETTPETTPEQLGAEVSSEASAESPVTETPTEEISPTQKLAEEVKAKLLACVEASDCLDALSARFDQMARRLGVPTDKLIDEVFSLLTRGMG